MCAAGSDANAVNSEQATALPQHGRAGGTWGGIRDDAGMNVMKGMNGMNGK